MTPGSRFGLVAAVALLPATLAAPAAAAPGPPDAEIADAVFVGAGCDRAAGRVELKDDALLISPGRALQVTAGIRENGNHVPRATTNCQVNVRFANAAGWQFAVTTVEGAGRSALAPGGSGRFILTSYLAGTPDTLESSIRLTGPTWGDWGYSGGSSPNWSDCGATRALNVNTRLQVEAGTVDPDTRSTIGVNSESGVRLVLSWRAC
ncbi:DUF4360 domain-containing protein [Pilimelia terevasa]|nr:DUF4360 domain-containing protein [Pilimelia terevasa]